MPEKDWANRRDRLIELLIMPFLRLFAWRPVGLWGGFALIILLVFGRHQITPGREWIDLDWPVGIYYGFIAAAGAVAGFLGGERRLLAMLAGAVAAVGSFAVAGIMLRYVPQFPLLDRLWSWGHVFGLAVGLLPGIGLYAAVDYLVTRNHAEAAAAKAKTRLQRRRRARGLSDSVEPEVPDA